MNDYTDNKILDVCDGVHLGQKDLTINKEKKIIFADERGKNIADVSIVIPFIYFDLLNILMSIALFFPQNIYCDQLHYSTAGYNNSELQKGCCTIS